MPLCFLTPSGSRVLTHPRQADQAICFPGLCAQKRCSFLQTLLQNPSVQLKASLWCSHPMGLVRTMGTARPGMGTARPAKPPLLLARGLHCRYLQHFPSFLLTPQPSAMGGFAAFFQQDHSVPTDDSAPPFKSKLLYAYFCVASDLPDKASVLLASPHTHVQPDIYCWLF